MMSRTVPNVRRACRPPAGPALVLIAALAAVAFAAPAARAQGAKLRVGDRPGKYAEAKNVKVYPLGNKTDESILWLRPNDKGQFSLFIQNPANQERHFVVRFVGADKTTVLAKSSEVKVAAGATTGVSLAAPAPVKKVAPEGTPPPPAEGIAVEGPPPQFELWQLTRAAGAKPEAQPEETLVDRLRVALLRPKRYLLSSAPAYTPATHRLSVGVEATKFLAGEPCPVKMTLQFEDPKTKRLKEFIPAKGVFERSVTAEQKATLFAEDPRLADFGDVKGVVTLSADGYERAFRYQVNFSGTSGTIRATPLDDPAVWLVSPEYGVPGVPLPVRVGVDNVGQLATAELTQLDAEVSVRLQLGHGTGKAFDDYLSRTLPGHRRRRLLFDLAGAEGAVGYRTEVHDWAVDLPTRGVFGENSVRAQGVDADGKVIRVNAGTAKEYDLETVAPVMLDGTPPSIVSGQPDGKKLLRGSPLPVVARVKAPPSGLRSVAFVTAKLVPDPKVPGAFLIPEGASRVPATHRAKEDKDGVEVWEAVLAEVPTDKKGKVEVAVEAVSNTGLKDLGRFEVVLTDAPPAAAAKLGSIKGKVLEGGRPQAKQLVVLRDPMGALKADATTNDAGEFVFKNLAPGPYVVAAAKSKSATKGETPVQVMAGKEAAADINLLR